MNGLFFLLTLLSINSDHDNFRGLSTSWRSTCWSSTWMVLETLPHLQLMIWNRSFTCLPGSVLSTLAQAKSILMCLSKKPVWRVGLPSRHCRMWRPFVTPELGSSAPNLNYFTPYFEQLKGTVSALYDLLCTSHTPDGPPLTHGAMKVILLQAFLAVQEPSFGVTTDNVPAKRCHAPNVFGTVDMEKVSWRN